MSYSSQSNHGELFGLRSTDLTAEQLAKVNVDKLIECVGYDHRVFEIICDTFSKAPAENIGMIIKMYKDFDQWNSDYTEIREEIRDKILSVICSNAEFGAAVVNRLIYMGF